MIYPNYLHRRLSNLEILKAGKNNLYIIKNDFAYLSVLDLEI